MAMLLYALAQRRLSNDFAIGDPIAASIFDHGTRS
jgi:hypothetical protein